MIPELEHERVRRAPRRRAPAGSNVMDYRKEFRHLYTATDRRVEIVHAPKLNYLAIDGLGHPGPGSLFQKASDTLCRISLEMRLEVSRADVMEYLVMPVECIWWADEPGPAGLPPGDPRWTLMVMQPVVLPPAVEAAKERLAALGESGLLLDEVRLVKFYEGLAAQTLSRSPEPCSGDAFDRIAAFIAENGYRANGLVHEIYLDGTCFDPGKRMQKIVRQPVTAASA